MTREDIIRMARDAGWNGIYARPLFSIYMQETNFLHFATLVAAAEREECAKVCEELRYDGYEMVPHDRVLAQRIRARGEK